VETIDTSVTLFGDAPPTVTSEVTVAASPTSGPSPTPTLPSSTPPASATAPPADTPGAPSTPAACANALVNGGFEAGTMGWQLGGEPVPVAVGEPVLTGDGSLRVGPAAPPGGAGVGGAWQGVDVPPWAETIDVSAWAWQRSTGPGGTDAQMVLLTASDPALTDPRTDPAGIVFEEVVDAASWRRWSLTTGVRRFEAPRLWVYAAVANDGRGGRAWMHIDEVAVRFCP
jgi:hypothetical protein